MDIPNGRALARRYAEDVVIPLVAATWPGLRFAVGRLGSGSDVLGLDDEMSRDHDWGLRLTLLVPPERAAEVDRTLEHLLPETFLDRPVRFATTWEPVVRHRVEVAGPAAFAQSRLGVDASRPLSVDGWLSVTGQSVLEVVAGPLFLDTDGETTRIRARLDWYPDDVWRYVVAADWARLGQELPFVGRTAERGDDLGSRVVTARLAHTAMHLALLLERQWPPYPKWLGSRLAARPAMSGIAVALANAVTADAWPGRQAALAEALDGLYERQAAVGLPGGTTAVEPFWDRPYLGVAPAVTERLLASVVDDEVRALVPGVGSVEQWVDNVDVLVDPGRRARLAVRPPWRR